MPYRDLSLGNVYRYNISENNKNIISKLTCCTNDMYRNEDYNMKTAAIILSGGKGKRMGASVSKQYLELEGYPVLYYALNTFEKSSVDYIIIVCGEGEESYVRENIVNKYNIKKTAAIVAGGKERYNSVHNGLKAIEEKCPDTDIVLIHDGARAFVSEEIIEKLIQCCRTEKACVAAVKAKDTIKISDAEGYIKETPSRETVWQIQTPQTFKYDIIKKAYDFVLSGDTKDITDDAMVLEKYCGQRIKLVEASYDNIKITTPEDMIFGKAILNNKV